MGVVNAPGIGVAGTVELSVLVNASLANKAFLYFRK
jgi:hypothetical protein